MHDEKQWIGELYKTLHSFVEKSFPKKCASCGKTYANLEEFLSQTKNMERTDSFLEAMDYDYKSIVDLSRNCSCGSTLMVVFNERRNMSGNGIRIRKRFDKLVGILNAAGIETDVARQELLKMLHREDSEILKNQELDIHADEIRQLSLTNYS